jgi:DUF4097 and DUF4098 domain-containing protein YvlB
MKFYHVWFTIILLSSTTCLHSFWNKWVDTISAKINNSTELIMHKEFPKAQLIEINNEQGSIIINSWKQDSIAIEVITSCAEAVLKDIKVDIEYIDNSIKIHTIFVDPKVKGSVLFNILVPHKINIVVVTKQGDIVVKDVYGKLNLQTVSGDIKLLNPHENTEAKTSAGSIIIRTDLINPNKEFNLETDKGNIEFYTTTTIHTRLLASALQGKITSDLPITLTSKITKLDAAAWKEFRQVVDGSIGTSTSTLNMTALNGSIAILPYTKQNDIF